MIHVPEDVIAWAKMHCQHKADERRDVAADLAAAQNHTNHVKLGYVFQRVRDSAWYAALKGKRLDEVNRVLHWVSAELTVDFYLSAWSGDLQTRLFSKRMDVGVASTTREGSPVFLAPAGRNTAAKDMKTLKTIFNRALEMKHREGSSRDLLHSNPMAKYRLPKFGSRRRREIVDSGLFVILLKYADQVDPSGRLRFFLVLLRWTGERVSTIRRLEVGSLLFSAADIRTAFDRQLCNYIQSPRIRDKAADLYARSGGAIYFRAWMRKPGTSGDADRTEQYDAVIPVHPNIREEWDRYREKYLVPRTLHDKPAAPLFTGERLDQQIPARSIHLWWHALVGAAERGEGRTDLALSKGNAYHGLRYNRRTELRKVETKYARWLVGHSVTNGTPGITVSEGIYLGLKPRELVAAVLVSDAGEEDEDW